MPPAARPKSNVVVVHAVVLPGVSRGEATGSLWGAPTAGGRAGTEHGSARPRKMRSGAASCGPGQAASASVPMAVLESDYWANSAQTSLFVPDSLASVATPLLATSNTTRPVYTKVAGPPTSVGNRMKPL